MLDFFKIRERDTKKGVIEVYPDFLVKRNGDLMTRGKAFYAVWDEAAGLWSTDEFRLIEIVDMELSKYVDAKKSENPERTYIAKRLSDYGSKRWDDFKLFLSKAPDNCHDLDQKIIFADSKPDRKNYASKKLPYSLDNGSFESYDELISTLYAPEERQKLEWAIGSIFTGDSVKIQKFIVLYGAQGAGKSTFLDIVMQLFNGYYTTFDAKSLTGSNQFATEVFKSNPLVAIQHDGDLSRIEDNSRLNSIISHEQMAMNEKYKAVYQSSVNAFLFMGTNKPVQITDSKSGLIRRLIDVQPTGRRIPPERYFVLKDRVSFELGSIATHCIEVYRSMGRYAYADYTPLAMMEKTDRLFNFIQDNFDTLAGQEYTPLKQLWDMYKTYCDESNFTWTIPKFQFREEMKDYFEEYLQRSQIDGTRYYGVYHNLKQNLFAKNPLDLSDSDQESKPSSLVMDQSTSILDDILKDCPAQYANSTGTPTFKWDRVTGTLKDLDTHKLHYVKVPKNMIVIDFDIKNNKGEKDAALNIEQASKLPPTYAEYSQGGAGVHLHYWWDGDPDKLSNLYSDNVEIKVFRGDASLRRRLSQCNNLPIAHISSGLPLKEEKPVIDLKYVKSEAGLRNLIMRNLHKQIHPGTKPSIDFICTILDEAYENGLKYDVTDMKPVIIDFASKSTHWADYCLKVVNNMKFASEERNRTDHPLYEDGAIAFFDIEVFPNLFLVNWKYQGSEQCVEMINPEPADMLGLMKLKLIGFNCRRYDNHLIYARYLGYDNTQLYNLSQNIVNGNRGCMFGEAYNLSYTDVYDFCSKKQSLKKWEIELGIHHEEWALPWDQPVDPKLWPKLAHYCNNDVIATEKVFEARVEDWNARKMLARLSGLTVNDTTNSHVMQYLFGNEKNPQSHFIYTDLATGKRYAWPDAPEYVS